MLYDKSSSSFNDLTHCQLQSVVDTMPHNPFMLFLGVLLQAQARFLQCLLCAPSQENDAPKCCSDLHQKHSNSTGFNDCWK